jgi:PPK2 family polyphosphate:nucleotide phosphotransferase
MLKSRFVRQFRVAPGSKVDLRKFPTDWAGTKEARKLAEDDIKDRAKEVLEKNKLVLAKTQDLIYGSNTHSVLLIFQAMDAAGKDGTIRHVMSGVNPQSCQVFSFKKPSAEERDHNFLWRYMKSLPERGRIGIFNRSYYEDVLVVKVHPEYLDQAIPDGKAEKFWKGRYDDINSFEKHLSRSGTVILKFFLHVSKGEQRRRFLERLSDEEKYWKFSISDMEERKYWKEYQRAFEDALSATSTDYAPWFVIPADRKYVARALVADIIAKAISDLDLEYPKPTKEDIKRFEVARAELEQEEGIKKESRNGHSKNGKKKKSKRSRKVTKPTKSASIDAALAAAKSVSEDVQM